MLDKRSIEERIDIMCSWDEVDQLKEQLETLRIQLAVCGIAAMANTESTIADRITRTNPYWSASYMDVCNAVDREMSLRDENARLRAELAASQDHIDLMLDEFERIKSLLYIVEGPLASEIKDLCDRATTNTMQRVTVIKQRDQALERVRELEAKLAALKVNCDCEYLGVCRDDPQKADYCPLNRTGREQTLAGILGEK